MRSFGGAWSEQKLTAFEKYLNAYLTILKKQSFHKTYIDAFAGCGYRAAVAPDPLGQQVLPYTPDDSASQFARGSVSIALQSELAFERYVFIEQDESTFESLQQHINQHFPDRADRVWCRCGDANDLLAELCKGWSPKDRAMIFLDPFGMQVHWDTIRAIAGTRAADLMILFPLGVAVNRMLTRSGNISTSWRNHLDNLFGTSDWYNAFYAAPRTADLFGGDRVEKQTSIPEIADYYLGRLKTVFPHVATKPLYLRNSRRSAIFALCFAAANPRGGQIAVRVANDIFGKG